MEQMNEQNKQLERQTPEESKDDETLSIRDLFGPCNQKDSAKTIVEKILLGRIRKHLNKKPGFHTEKINAPHDLLSRSEIMALKNITKTLKSLVEEFEQEVTRWGMKYGDEAYFETLKLTTQFKTDIIPKLNKIQRDEQGIETQVLLVMLKDKLECLNPKLKEKLYNTHDSLKVLLPEPGVALAVEHVLAEFENKYMNVVFNNQSLRYAACALVYRIRKMLACHLYWFETPKIDGGDFQLLYSLRKLIFLHMSQFVGKVSPNLLYAVRDIYSLERICSQRRQMHRVIDYCLDRYSAGKHGLFFKTVKDVLQDIRKKLGEPLKPTEVQYTYTFQALGHGILLFLFITK